MVQGRKRLVESRVALENHIRGILKVFGVKVVTTSPYTCESKIKEALHTLDTLAAATLSTLLESRAALWRQERVLDIECESRAKRDDVCQRLMTIPGVGVQTALAYRAEIDDPSRFRKSRDAGCI